MIGRSARRIANSAARDVTSIADSHALIALAVLLAAAAILTWWLRRSDRARHRSGALFGALASVCVIVAVTLLRYGWPQRVSLGALPDWSADGFERLRTDPFASSGFVLNVALFVPAGAMWTWMTRRAGRTVVALAAGSLLVESLQAVFGLGAADVADLVANGLGALLGVGIGLVALRVRGDRTASEMSRRRRWLTAAALTAAAVTAVVTVLIGADRHQRSIERELRTAFAATTKADLDRWNADGTMLPHVFAAVSVFADGTQYAPDEVRVRYPASFLGVHRCVFVVWPAASPVRFERRSGDVCTAFIG